MEQAEHSFFFLARRRGVTKVTESLRDGRERVGGCKVGVRAACAHCSDTAPLAGETPDSEDPVGGVSGARGGSVGTGMYGRRAQRD